MGRLNTMQSKVENVLRIYPETRDSDRLLICSIYRSYYNVNVWDESFADVLADETLPSFETIRRCRQKAQSDHVELRGMKDRERLDRQKEYVEYALGE